MLKKITIFFILLVGLYTFAKAQTYSESINKFHADILINKDGSISVSEKIQYNFGTNQRHGIFRKIPYTKKNQEGKVFVMDFTGFAVSDENGTPYKFTTSKLSPYYSLKIGDAEKIVSGIKTYVIKYKVSGALTYFKDFDELYWNITGNEWEYPILNASAEIIVPASDAGVRSIKCYTGSSGSTDSNCAVEVGTESSTSVAVTSNKMLTPGEGITFAVTFQKGLVAQLEPKEDKTGLIVLLAMLLYFIFFISFYVIFPLYVFLQWRKDYVYTKRNAKIVSAWFDPPKNDDRSFYTPAETGCLIDKKTNISEVSATLIHLAQKGYLKIKSTESTKLGFIKSNEISFTRLKSFEEDDSLTTHEKTLLKAIFKNDEGGTVLLEDLKTSTSFAVKIATFYTNVEDLLHMKKLFEKKLSHYRNVYLIIGILSFFIFNVPLALVCFIFGIKSAKKTALGVEKYSEAVSLKNFLVSQTEQLNFQSKNQMFFEKLLPYATAFGVEKIWAEKFKDLTFTKSDWYDGNLNNTSMYTALTHSLNSAVSSSVSYSNSRSSSGFSSGSSGGSSGGGGGGGGGGSW